MRSRLRLPSLELHVERSEGKLFTHKCHCHQAVRFGTDKTVVMLWFWNGDGSSVVALSCVIDLVVGLNDQTDGDEH